MNDPRWDKLRITMAWIIIVAWVVSLTAYMIDPKHHPIPYPVQLAWGILVGKMLGEGVLFGRKKDGNDK